MDTEPAVRVGVGDGDTGDGGSVNGDRVRTGAGRGGRRRHLTGSAGRDGDGVDPHLAEVEEAVTIGVARRVDRGAVGGVSHGDIRQRGVALVRHGVGDEHVTVLVDQRVRRVGVSIERGLNRRLQTDLGVDGEPAVRVGVGDGDTGDGGSVNGDRVRTGAGRGGRRRHLTGSAGRDGDGVDPHLAEVEEAVTIGVARRVDRGAVGGVSHGDIRQRGVALVRHGVGDEHVTVLVDQRVRRVGVSIERGLNRGLQTDLRCRDGVVGRVAARDLLAGDRGAVNIEGLRAGAGHGADVHVAASRQCGTGRGAQHLVTGGHRSDQVRCACTTHDGGVVGDLVVGDGDIGEWDVAGVGDLVGPLDRRGRGDQRSGCRNVRVERGLDGLLDRHSRSRREVVGDIGVGHLVTVDRGAVGADGVRADTGHRCGVGVGAGGDRVDGELTGHGLAGSECRGRAGDGPFDAVGDGDRVEVGVAGVRHHIGEPDLTVCVDQRAGGGGVGIEQGLHELLDVDRGCRDVEVVGVQVGDSDTGDGGAGGPVDRGGGDTSDGAGRRVRSRGVRRDGERVHPGLVEVEEVVAVKVTRDVGGHTESGVGDDHLGERGVAGVGDRVRDQHVGGHRDERAGACGVGVEQGLNRCFDVDAGGDGRPVMVVCVGHVVTWDRGAVRADGGRAGSGHRGGRCDRFAGCRHERVGENGVRPCLGRIQLAVTVGVT